jgi:hypothetical protein
LLRLIEKGLQNAADIFLALEFLKRLWPQALGQRGSGGISGDCLEKIHILGLAGTALECK